MASIADLETWATRESSQFAQSWYALSDMGRYSPSLSRVLRRCGLLRDTISEDVPDPSDVSRRSEGMACRCLGTASMQPA